MCLKAIIIGVPAFPLCNFVYIKYLCNGCLGGSRRFACLNYFCSSSAYVLKSYRPYHQNNAGGNHSGPIFSLQREYISADVSAIILMIPQHMPSCIVLVIILSHYCHLFVFYICMFRIINIILVKIHLPHYSTFYPKHTLRFSATQIFHIGTGYNSLNIFHVLYKPYPSVFVKLTQYIIKQ